MTSKSQNFSKNISSEPDLRIWRKFLQVRFTIIRATFPYFSNSLASDEKNGACLWRKAPEPSLNSLQLQTTALAVKRSATASAHYLGQDVNQRVVAVPTARVHRYAGGFVHDQELGVFVDDLNSAIFDRSLVPVNPAEVNARMTFRPKKGHRSKQGLRALSKSAGAK